MEKHNLLHEFPEYQEKIAYLKQHDAHFKLLVDDYHQTEQHVHKINSGVEVVIDEFAHELKAKLLHLKDAIYTYLNKE